MVSFSNHLKGVLTSWHGYSTFKWKCNKMIISPSQGWKKAFFILLYSISTLSPLTDVKRKPENKQLLEFEFLCFQMDITLICLFVLRFNSPVNTIKVMSSRSVIYQHCSWAGFLKPQLHCHGSDDNSRRIHKSWWILVNPYNFVEEFVMIWRILAVQERPQMFWTFELFKTNVAQLQFKVCVAYL